MYVVPCGVSILDALSSGRGYTAPAPDELIAAAQDFAHEVHAGAISSDVVVDEWKRQMADLVHDSRLVDRGPEMCAETSSLAWRKDKHHRRLLDLSRFLSNADNQVLLLSSDTVKGLASALLVATRIAPRQGGQAPSYDAIRYATTADERLRTAIRPRAVTVARVVGLRPDARDGFIKGAAGLGRALRVADNAAGSTDIEVHLTSGLKATLLHLLSMTELLYSASASRVTAWYLHDEEDENQTRSTVQVGLRRFPKEYLSMLREELAEVSQGRLPPSRTHTAEGIAWERGRTGTVINGFGTGFLEVLGAPPARLPAEGA
jgi:hypothetical protein